MSHDVNTLVIQWKEPEGAACQAPEPLCCNTCADTRKEGQELALCEHLVSTHHHRRQDTPAQTCLELLPSICIPRKPLPPPTFAKKVQKKETV